MGDGIVRPLGARRRGERDMSGGKGARGRAGQLPHFGLAAVSRQKQVRLNDTLADLKPHAVGLRMELGGALTHQQLNPLVRLKPGPQQLIELADRHDPTQRLRAGLVSIKFERRGAELFPHAHVPVGGTVQPGTHGLEKSAAGRRQRDVAHLHAQAAG